MLPPEATMTSKEAYDYSLTITKETILSEVCRIIDCLGYIPKDKLLCVLYFISRTGAFKEKNEEILRAPQWKKLRHYAGEDVQSFPDFAIAMQRWREEAGLEKTIRNVEEFVTDLLGQGKTAEQVLAMAEYTRWKDSIKEIKELLEKGPR